MHLANGTLANDVCTVTAAVSTAALVYAGLRARGATPARFAKAALGSIIVLIGQMIDVPLFGGTGVHILGAAFLTLLAGPALALLGMSAVVITQALLLNDGGITALGANVLNMGVVAASSSAWALRAAHARLSGRAAPVVGAAMAAATSVFAAVSAMAIELALSGYSLASALALTMPAHAPFAAWETAATVVLVVAAARVRAFDPLASPSSH
jgi:cobalt/nickel transport system permease protein